MEDIKKAWDANLVDVASTSVPTKITTLRGGESITIKSLASSSQYHKIGTDRLLVGTRYYKLDTGETMTLTMPASFGLNACIEIWALASNAGDDVCWFKLTDEEPSTSTGT